TPAFRTSISFVEVDAFVTDGAGAFVRGLTKDDFEVYDDGVRQDVASFTVIDLPGPSQRQGWRAVTDDDLTRTYRSDTVPPESRVYALLLDRAAGAGSVSMRFPSAASPLNRAQTLARRFIEDAMAPDD